MSASLVGSEMCIRDRHHQVWRSRRIGYRSRLVAFGVGRVLRCVAEDGCCLLYTSDAADDM
eukprot:4923877-Alexandrium_andersonii.AAC.1